MKLTRVTEGSGQYQNPAVTGSHKPGLSRRGFIAATGMGVGLAAAGPSLVMEAKAASTTVKDPRKLKQIKSICGNCAVAVSYTHLTLPTIYSV